LTFASIAFATGSASGTAHPGSLGHPFTVRRARATTLCRLTFCVEGATQLSRNAQFPANQAVVTVCVSGGGKWVSTPPSGPTLTVHRG
jgi:hypothetical protein